MARRRALPTLILAAFLGTTFVGACASGGSAVLSQTRLTAEDLAATQYETVYDFLRAHSRARIISLRGNEFLTVYSRGGNIRSGVVTAASGGVEGQSRDITGTAAKAGGGEARLFVNGREVTGDVTVTIQQMPLSMVKELLILTPSETSARYGGQGYRGSVSIVTKDADGN